MIVHRSDPIAYLSGQLEPGPAPQSITAPGGGGKFTSQGAALPFAGNTFLCHIDPGSRAFGALVALQRRLRAGSHAEAFTFLPPQSFHMTIFQGISAGETGPGTWPEGVAQGAPRAEVSRFMLEAVRDLRLPQRAPVSACGCFAGHSLVMAGVTAQSEEALRGIRQNLASRLGMALAPRDTYSFHITLGYLLRWVGKDVAAEIVAHGDRCYAEVAGDLTDIEIGPVEFCEFDDMHHFEPLAHLGRNGIEVKALR